MTTLTDLRTTLHRWLILVGLWVASLGGWRPCSLGHLPTDHLLALARRICREADDRFPTYTGEQRRREAQRVLLNIVPVATLREVNLLIELAMQPAGEPTELVEAPPGVVAPADEVVG